MEKKQEEIFQEAKELSNYFFGTSHDIYSLLLLSMATVITYSERTHEPSTVSLIELATQITPDLIIFLEKEEIITQQESSHLTEEMKREESYIPLILRSYVCAAKGLRRSMKEPRDQDIKHCLVA